MPCYDYHDPTPYEIELSRESQHKQMLLELETAKKAAKIDSLTAMLCELCAAAEKDGNTLLPETLRWWKEHKEVDRRRIQEQVRLSDETLKELELQARDLNSKINIEKQRLTQLAKEQQQINSRS